MVKFQFLAQFPVDHLHQVMSSLFYCVSLIFALKYLILMTLICHTIRKTSISLLRFLFRNHIHGFSSEVSSVCRLKYSYSCFSSHFGFLVIALFVFEFSMLFLVTVIRLS